MSGGDDDTSLWRPRANLCHESKAVRRSRHVHICEDCVDIVFLQKNESLVGVASLEDFEAGILKCLDRSEAY